MKTVFEKSIEGRRGVTTKTGQVPTKAALPANLLRETPAELPELSELDVARHFTALADMNFGVDTGFYPLGSCTMKYNPKINEQVAALPGFANIHPVLPQLKTGENFAQGSLEVIYNLEEQLREITGMKAVTLQPLAGSHGELTGVMLMAAYHRAKGNNKTHIIIPDSAHGTNPASAMVAGYKIKSVKTGDDGTMDLDALAEAIDDETAGLMITCPNTLGIFNPQIHKMADMIHAVDGLMYYDGANLNAVMGHCRPGDLGFDVCHLNLHKTFSTPHGGGGPGSGPVGVSERLVPFLPTSQVEKLEDGTFALTYDRPDSMGYIAPFYGNFAIFLRAYVYITQLGAEGIKTASYNAVLNANYIRKKLMPYYDLPYPQTCMHECVFSAKRQTEHDVHAIDVAKGLIDRGFHPPTIYFPLIVPEALMIEPTETESRETLDAFIDAMIDIAKQAEENPKSLQEAPITKPVTRLDEVTAARKPVVADL